MDKLTTNEIPKSVIVAGNGKSLAQIDYSLLPEKYDVFRCNQFYFEDSYYLGKRIKSVFFNVSVIVEQYYTLHHLIKNKEYTCDNIVLSSFSTLPNESENTKNVKNIFPDVINGYEHYISKLKDFDQYLFFKEMFEDKRVTSGVYMVAVAVAQGYKDIYLTGIDFYLESKTTYVFDHKKKNLLKLLPSFGSNISHSNLHNKNTELEALFFLKDNYNVNIYCISPDSPLFEYFPA
ncbi:TPA: CMP-Neu5Ac--lipooligosaccharide alpha 2-3 sialyltransferase, partial [Pasteurella multocida]|nr:CMP-Neu5Ac--lipooligosaccharide alpha 2-3 sialyltransferase [Pasteurella multocida]